MNKHGRPKVAANKLRCKAVSIRLSRPEYASLRQMAGGIPVTEYLRSLVFSHQNKTIDKPL